MHDAQNLAVRSKTRTKRKFPRVTLALYLAMLASMLTFGSRVQAVLQARTQQLLQFNDQSKVRLRIANSRSCTPSYSILFTYL